MDEIPTYTLALTYLKPNTKPTIITKYLGSYVVGTTRSIQITPKTYFLDAEYPDNLAIHCDGHAYDFAAPYDAYDCIEFGYDSEYDVYEVSFAGTCINNDSDGKYKIRCYATDPKDLDSDIYELYFVLYENYDVVFGDNYASYADYNNYDAYEIHISQNDDDFII